MRLMKVFDCQDMPDDLRRTFFDIAAAGNDCFVVWSIKEGDEQINSWLLEQGASPEDDEVLIKHWW